MSRKNSNTISLEDFKEKHYGKRGTQKREQLEKGYEHFKIGFMIKEASGS